MIATPLYVAHTHLRHWSYLQGGQYSKIQYSVVQYSVVQYSTVQYSPLT